MLSIDKVITEHGIVLLTFIGDDDALRPTREGHWQNRFHDMIPERSSSLVALIDTTFPTHLSRETCDNAMGVGEDEKDNFGEFLGKSQLDAYVAGCDSWMSEMHGNHYGMYDEDDYGEDGSWKRYHEDQDADLTEGEGQKEVDEASTTNIIEAESLKGDDATRPSGEEQKSVNAEGEHEDVARRLANSPHEAAIEQQSAAEGQKEDVAATTSIEEQSSAEGLKDVLTNSNVEQASVVESQHEDVATTASMDQTSEGNS